MSNPIRLLGYATVVLLALGLVVLRLKIRPATGARQNAPVQGVAAGTRIAALPDEAPPKGALAQSTTQLADFTVRASPLPIGQSWQPLPAAQGYLAYQQFPSYSAPAQFVQLLQVTQDGICAGQRYFWPGNLALHARCVWADGRALCLDPLFRAPVAGVVAQLEADQLTTADDAQVKLLGRPTLPVEPYRGFSPLAFMLGDEVVLCQPATAGAKADWVLLAGGLRHDFKLAQQLTEVAAIGAVYTPAGSVPAVLLGSGRVLVYSPAQQRCLDNPAYAALGLQPPQPPSEGLAFVIGTDLLAARGKGSWRIRRLSGGSELEIVQSVPGLDYPDAAGRSAAEAHAYQQGRSRQEQEQDADLHYLIMEQQLALVGRTLPADRASFRAVLALGGPNCVLLLDQDYNRVIQITGAAP